MAESAGCKMNPLDILNNQKPMEEKILHRDDRLSFGKYRGRFICDVLDSDPEYLEWVIDNTTHVFDDELKGEIFAAASAVTADKYRDEQDYFGGPQSGDLPF